MKTYQNPIPIYDIDEAPAHICQMIKQYRLLTKMKNGRTKTQASMAEDMNISLSKYGKIETGRGYLHLDDLLAVCNILNVHLEDLLQTSVKARGAEAAPASVHFTDAQFADLKAALLPIVRDVVYDVATAKGKKKTRRHEPGLAC